MDQDQGLGRGLDPKLLLGGLVLTALGLGGAGLGLFTDFGVRIGPVPIPLSIVGPLVALVGLYVVVISMRQEKCLACNSALDTYLAAFVLQAEQQVITAVDTLDGRALAGLAAGSHAGPNVQVTLEACPRCKRIGRVEVAAFRPERAVVRASRVISGPSVSVFAAAVAARAAEASEDG